jgi:hypothetical protein
LELSKRGVDKSTEEWFHTVFYCVQVGGARIEDFEINLIQEFLNNKYSVIILLTKADQGSKNDVEVLKNIMIKEFKIEIPVIPICSVDGVRFDNSRFTKFGKEKVEIYVYNDFWNSISLRLPERCERVIYEWIDSWVKKVRKSAIAFLNKKNKDRAYSYIEEEAELHKNKLSALW